MAQHLVRLLTPPRFLNLELLHSVDKDRSKLHQRLPRTTSNNAHAHVDRIDVHDDDFAIAPKKLDMDIDNLKQQLDDTGEK
jgi:hypothetical protein